ncbi:MAG TPA: hypothetical protein PLL99_07360 [Chitinophagales bacterium]|nr:hypothetical protein [Chitinophagales bacterium]
MVGGWKGYMLTDTTNADNKKGLPATLFISYVSSDGELAGEMTVQYRYQSDIYRAKYEVTGQYNFANSQAFIEQQKIVFHDILPKGLQWCFGSGYFRLKRNPYKKKSYLDGIMTTDCGKEMIRIVLIKK